MIDSLECSVKVTVEVILRNGLVRGESCKCFTTAHDLGFEYQVVNILIALRPSFDPEVFQLLRLAMNVEADTVDKAT